MKIKFATKYSQQEQSLWRDSPCSYNYVLQNPSIDNASKFQIGSIYYRDEVNKPKKVFTDFEKPDLLLLDFRRQIQEASHPKYNTSTKQANEEKKKDKIRSKSQATTAYTKLYSVPEKNDYKYDKFGMRCNYTGDYNVKLIEESVKNKKKSFSYGRRVDLSRPNNFYPGPGTYNPSNPYIQDFPEIQKRRTFSDFRKVNQKDIMNAQTEKNWRKKSQV